MSRGRHNPTLRSNSRKTVKEIIDLKEDLPIGVSVDTKTPSGENNSRTKTFSEGSFNKFKSCSSSTSFKSKKKNEDIVDVTLDDPAIIHVVGPKKEENDTRLNSTSEFHVKEAWTQEAVFTDHRPYTVSSTSMMRSISSHSFWRNSSQICKRTFSVMQTVDSGPNSSSSTSNEAKKACITPEDKTHPQDKWPANNIKHTTKWRDGKRGQHTMPQYQHQHVEPQKQQDLLSFPKDQRTWELTSLGRRCRHRHHNGTEFTFMSYNILSQDLLWDNMYLYTGRPDEVLEWSNRRDKLLQEIKYFKPDIMCLQEVNNEHYNEFFVPELRSLGYRGVYKQRTGNKKDGCAIIYSERKFESREIYAVEYLQRPYSILDRDNVGLIVNLKLVSGKSNQSVCVANTHLLYNPSRGDIKLAQLMMLLAEIDRWSSNSESSAHCPVILCGDFNSTPRSDIVQFISRGYLRYENLIVGEMSGQKEKCTRNKILQRNFFPKQLGISDQCRYIDRLCIQDVCVDNPGNVSHDNNSLDRAECPGQESPKPGSPRSESSQSKSQAPEENTSRKLFRQNSGKLQHHFNFESVYKHRIERHNFKEPEVTTSHNKEGINVDYIFYNVLETSRYSKNYKRSVKEGRLRLLSRLGLLSHREIQELGNLPNQVHPSDHLPLLAKFVLE